MADENQPSSTAQTDTTASRKPTFHLPPSHFGPTATLSNPSPEPQSGNPFADPSRNMTSNPSSGSSGSSGSSDSSPKDVTPTGKVGDIGFGYIQDAAPIVSQTVQANPSLGLDGQKSPLKSAMKSPGAPPRMGGNNPLSPTFKEEDLLEKAEALTDKEQEKDLRIKLRVRLAKIILRGVNFSCSLVVLSLLAATFQIFNATKALPPRNGLPPWSRSTPMWPQITLLCIAIISLTFAVFILYSNIRHGHRRAEKVAVYYTTFAVAFFVFNIVMWGIGAAILSGSLNSQNGNDLWGWACKDNRRRQLFEDEVSYGLVCRLQNWALICAIIEIVIELFIITIYGFVFYRFWSKRKLRKSLAVRDKARSDLYLAQLRSQTVPNTPALQSPRSAAFMRSPRAGAFTVSSPFAKDSNSPSDALPVIDEKPFSLQPVPRQKKGATDLSPTSEGVSPASSFNSDVSEKEHQQNQTNKNGRRPVFFPPPERKQDHIEAAPGEQQYAAVPIPGSYNHGPTSTGNGLSNQSSGDTLASRSATDVNRQ